MAIRYTEEAEADLMGIIDYGIDNDQPDPVAYVRTLRQRFQTLDVNRVPGRKGRVPGTKEWVVTVRPISSSLSPQKD